tara:strand:- start:71 stop:949 length:879 start_codon:yes stop_codon:yes gene_type:complete
VKISKLTALEAFKISPHPSFKHTTYFDVYDKIFNAYQDREITFVEVGVLHGGSLFMWREFFGPKAKIIGVDLNPRAKKWEVEGFEIRIGDQSDPSFWRELTSEFGSIDVFLDDGGHTYKQQIITAECVLDSICNGGILVVEDTHTSYMEGFGDRNFSFIKYAKLWIDRINSRFSSFDTDQNGHKIWSVEFFDSIVAFKVTKKASGLKSEPIWNIQNAQYDGDFRHLGDAVDFKKFKEIQTIMKLAFSIDNKLANNQITITKDRLFGLLNVWLEQHPQDREELRDLIAKSLKV